MEGTQPATDRMPLPPSRLRWFRALALLSPILLVGLAELGLRLAGFGYPTGFFLSQTYQGQRVFVENERFGWRFFGPALARTPRRMVIPVVKPAGTVRVFVLGESAAYGDPKPDFGLPRVLEVLLRERFPGTRFEVINAAMTGINSQVILPIARDCAEKCGDIWVIYMGHNEVVGPYGSGTVFGPQAPALSLIRCSVALKATRLGQLLQGVAARLRGSGASQAEWGMGLFLEHQVRHDDPRMEAVYSHFARNLADILRVGRNHGAKIVVSTVVSNLKNCAPFASQHPAGLAEHTRMEWARLYYAGIQAELSGRTNLALEHYQQAERLDGDYAELHFRWGKCCLALGHADQARRHLVLARDYDTLRFRADTRINEAIRKTAQGREQEGIRLTDSDAVLASESPQGLPGEELLYEHVHLNFQGNYLLARNLADELVRLLPERVTRQQEAGNDWVSATECARRLAWTDWDRFKTLKSMLLRYNEPPFTAQADHEHALRRIQEQMEALLPAVSGAGLRQSAGQYRQALALAPADWPVLRNAAGLLMKLGDLEAAEGCCRQVAELLPQDALARLELGLVLLQEGRAEAALEQFGDGLRLGGEAVPLLNAQALALAKLGRQDEALRQYAAALRVKPTASETHFNLGTALESLGRKEEATDHFRQGLQFCANTPEARLRAGNVALTHGWTNQALSNLSLAVQLNPFDAPAQLSLAGALEARGRIGEAEKHLSEAVRLNPELPAARAGLGGVLRKQGKELEAIEQLSAAVKLNPGFINARLNLGACLRHQRRMDEARQQFEEVLRLEPTNETARKYLALP